jgi:hypothetical protein
MSNSIAQIPMEEYLRFISLEKIFNKKYKYVGNDIFSIDGFYHLDDDLVVLKFEEAVRRKNNQINELDAKLNYVRKKIKGNLFLAWAFRGDKI